jgi:L-amino acid N-acyltransferase YncA
MAIAAPKIAREQEVQRLKALIPKCLRDSIKLHISTGIRESGPRELVIGAVKFKSFWQLGIT